jgi:hypothetical protein
LSADERKSLFDFLEITPRIKKIDNCMFLLNDRLVDFSIATQLPEPPRGFNASFSAIIGWIGSQPWVLRKLHKFRELKLNRDIKGV